MKNRGFTLVELLVALAITSVLATLLLGIVSATMDVWQKGRNQIDTFASARQVLGRMADEMKGAVARSTPAIEFSENVGSLGGTAPVAKTSENVFFIAPYPNSGSGDLCVIAYRHDSTTHELQRAFVESQNAWNATPKYQAGGYTGNLLWRTIAQGVVEFEVRSFSQNDLDTSNNDPMDTWSSTGTNSGMIGNVPRRIILRMKVLDDKSLARLIAASSNVTVYNRIITQSAREFTADVPMLSPSPTPTP